MEFSDTRAESRGVLRFFVAAGYPKRDATPKGRIAFAKGEFPGFET